MTEEWVQRVVNFPSDLDAEMRQLCQEHGINKSDFIREAVAAALKQIKSGGDALEYFKAGKL
jgi:Arc/MetJ-type ribon-helix-helix transcriptional regulator